MPHPAAAARMILRPDVAAQMKEYLFVTSHVRPGQNLPVSKLVPGGLGYDVASQFDSGDGFTSILLRGQVIEDELRRSHGIGAVDPDPSPAGRAHQSKEILEAIFES